MSLLWNLLNLSQVEGYGLELEIWILKKTTTMHTQKKQKSKPLVGDGDEDEEVSG